MREFICSRALIFLCCLLFSWCCFISNNALAAVKKQKDNRPVSKFAEAKFSEERPVRERRESSPKACTQLYEDSSNLVVPEHSEVEFGPRVEFGKISNEMMPSENPNTQYYFNVKGHIDPLLQDDMTLKWYVIYESNNPACYLTEIVGTARQFVQLPRQYKHIYTIKLDSKGNYDISIPVDKFIKGFCLWDIHEVGYQINDIHANDEDKTESPIASNEKLKMQVRPEQASSIVYLPDNKAYREVYCISYFHTKFRSIFQPYDCTPTASTDYYQFLYGIRSDRNYLYVLNFNFGVEPS